MCVRSAETRFASFWPRTPWPAQDSADPPSCAARPRSPTTPGAENFAQASARLSRAPPGPQGVSLGTGQPGLRWQTAPQEEGKVAPRGRAPRSRIPSTQLHLSTVGQGAPSPAAPGGLSRPHWHPHFLSCWLQCGTNELAGCCPFPAFRSRPNLLPNASFMPLLCSMEQASLHLIFGAC